MTPRRRANSILQIVRHFNVEVKDVGRFVVSGGVAYNENFVAILTARS
jgi:hypothetical protein